MENSSKDNTSNNEPKNTSSVHNCSDLAVIVCTKNSGSTIKNLLLNIKQSYFKPDIIVVDGFSTDDTVKITNNVISHLCSVIQNLKINP